MAQTKAQLVVGLNVNASAPASALQIDASGNVNLDSNTLYVDATNNRVGIGTSSPGAKLHSVETSAAEGLRVDGASGGFSLVVEGGTTRVTRAKQVTIGNSYVGNTPPTDGLIVQGSVGIGTTSPGDLLHIAGAYGAGAARFEDTANTNSIGKVFGYAGGLYLQSRNNTNYGEIVFRGENSGGTAERARIDSSGRLLVGTSSARSMLGVTPGIQSEATSFSQGILSLTMNSTAGNAYPILCFARSGGTTLGSNAVVSNGDIVGKMFFVAADGTDMDSSVATIEAVVDGTPGSNDLPGRIVFSTTADGSNIPTERMRITNGGNIQCSSQTELNGLKGIQLTGQANAYIYGGSTALYVYGTSGSSSGVYLTGNATAWLASSDERLKTDFENIDDGLHKVGTLRAVTGRYVFDQEGVRRSFLIAQDVQAVLPEAVKVQDDEQGTLGLAYTDVIPLLVAALKESKERIEQLEAKVAALESA